MYKLWLVSFDDQPDIWLRTLVKRFLRLTKIESGVRLYEAALFSIKRANNLFSIRIFYTVNVWTRDSVLVLLSGRATTPSECAEIVREFETGTCLVRKFPV